MYTLQVYNILSNVEVYSKKTLQLFHCTIEQQLNVNCAVESETHLKSVNITLNIFAVQLQTLQPT